MAKSRVDMIIETLRANPNEQFTARELAKKFIEMYPDDLTDKISNPRYQNRKQLISQIAAEIGGDRTAFAKQRCANVTTQDKPRPRLYYWNSNPTENVNFNEDSSQPDDEQPIDMPVASSNLEEKDLYPLLINFLHNELDLYCQRINEKTSKNSYGSNGNHWLHPDIVALEALDKGWAPTVKECMRNGNSSSIRIWSFEVKKQITRGNVRQSFFQAVSNSTWANFGYLVATGLNNDVEPELQMLSSLHGIGVLILNIESLFDSQILIPARERSNIDWQSVNRIVIENADFKNFVEQVGIYTQTGKIVKSVWNK